MERVMAELSKRFARDKLGSDASKAVLAERMRAEARPPTRDAVAVCRACAWMPSRRRCCVLASADGHQETCSVDRLATSVVMAVRCPCSMDNSLVKCVLGHESLAACCCYIMAVL